MAHVESGDPLAPSQPAMRPAVERPGRWSRFKAYVGPWLARPAGSTFVSLLVILAGVLSSVFTQEIKECWPIRWFGCTWGGLVFWAVAFAAALAYFVRQDWLYGWRRVQESEHAARWEAQTARQEEGVNQVAEIIRTMPPEGFLDDYAALFLGLSEATDECLRRTPGPTPEQVLAQLREVLQAIATLARRFDRGEASERYAANVMVFYGAGFLCLPANAGLRASIEQTMLDDADVDLEKLAGVLYLSAELSGSTDDATDPGEQGIQRDAYIQNLSLAIRSPDKHAGRYRILPGAPLAFSTHAYSGLADTLTFTDWARTHLDFKIETVERVQKYISEHPQIRSFQNHAVFRPGSWADDVEDSPIAVVNVHSSRPDLLSGGREELFPAMIMPLLRLVSLLITHEATAGWLPSYTQFLATLPAAKRGEPAPVAQAPSSTK